MAEAYHAGRDNQHGVSDKICSKKIDINIMVATIAFWNGINKSMCLCRFMADLPKNIEGHIKRQVEAGRRWFYQ
ncbi:hypothetical protein [Microcystis aeruginosa]|nr:hypothetical protein [Microcystis aeruginosa]